jgi:hypothetical protein
MFVPRNQLLYNPRTPDYTPNNSLLSEERLSPEGPPPNYLEGSPPDSPEGPPPNYTPPTPPSSSIPLTGGEKVHYRGDIKPSRLWNVEHIGPNFCTIVTDDDYHLNTEDTIKIVRPDEIYLPDDNFIYSMPMDIPLAMNMNNIPTTNQMPLENNPNIPNIHFAPVIKIINDGNDMSQQLASEPLTQTQPIIQTQTQTQSQSQPSLSEESELNTNEIDFSIPIIKK